MSGEQELLTRNTTQPLGLAWETMETMWIWLGHMILVLMDVHSKWIEVIPMDTSTSEATISKLYGIFVSHDQVETLVIDNLRNFTSVEFADVITNCTWPVLYIIELEDCQWVKCHQYHL